MTRVEIIARAFHAKFEDRTRHREPFYTKQKWEDIGEKCQEEFLEYAHAVDRALSERGRDA